MNGWLVIKKTNGEDWYLTSKGNYTIIKSEAYLFSSKILADATAKNKRGKVERHEESK